MTERAANTPPEAPIPAGHASSRTLLGPFHLLQSPTAEPTPVLVEIPHAGLAIPDVVRGELRAPLDGLLRDSDVYVDKLYADAPRTGATMLVALTSRYVVDLNRAPDDVDLQTVPDHPAPRGVQPRGVVWRMTTDGRSLLRRPLSFQQLRRRLEHFHRPYHDAIRSQLGALRERHGFAVGLAAHSMPGFGRGRGSHVVRRADVVPGTRGGRSADPRLIELIDHHFRDAGLSVRHDEPYRGGYTTAHYGRPRERWHVVQIELNRALYIDEATAEPRHGDFERLQGLLTELVRKVGAIDLR